MIGHVARLHFSFFFDNAYGLSEPSHPRPNQVTSFSRATSDQPCPGRSWPNGEKLVWRHPRSANWASRPGWHTGTTVSRRVHVPPRRDSKKIRQLAALERTETCNPVTIHNHRKYQWIHQAMGRMKRWEHCSILLGVVAHLLSWWWHCCVKTHNQILKENVEFNTGRQDQKKSRRSTMYNAGTDVKS